MRVQENRVVDFGRPKSPVHTAIYDSGAGQSVVRVVYSDESGIGAIDQEPITVVAGVMLNMSPQWPQVDREMAIVADEYPDLMSGPPGKREFKGKSLLKKLRRGTMPEVADCIMEILSITEKVRCPIFHGAVDRAGLARSQSRPRVPRELKEKTAIEWAFHDCMKAAQKYIGTICRGEDMLWIHDQASAHEPVLRMAHELFSESTGREWGLDWGRPMAMDGETFPGFILDTIFFGHSELSRAIQLADVCAAVIRAHYEGNPDAYVLYRAIDSAMTSFGPPRFSTGWQRVSGGR